MYLYAMYRNDPITPPGVAYFDDVEVTVHQRKPEAISATYQFNSTRDTANTNSNYVDRKQVEPPMDEKCLASLASNMPINKNGRMKSHHGGSINQTKWNGSDRWKPLDLMAPCIIWYVGANTDGTVSDVIAFCGY